MYVIIYINVHTSLHFYLSVSALYISFLYMSFLYISF